MAKFSNAYWPGFGTAGSQRSLLDRPARRLPSGAHSQDPAHEEDEAAASKETREKMREFLSAWNTADGDEQARILGDLVFKWRGDSAAGGLPVHSNNPLPSDFARTIAGLAAREGKQSVLEEAVAKLDPPIRSSVARQIYDWTQRTDQTLQEYRPSAELWDVEHGPALKQTLRDTLRISAGGPQEDIDGGSIGGKAIPLAARPSGPIYYEYDRPADSPPAPQKPYQPRSPTPEDALLDRIPESQGGPKDDFRSTGVSLRDPRGLDLKPFDPRAGYYERLARRADQLRRRGLVPRRGVDIDGRPYDSLMRVGTDRGSLRVTGLTPRGVEEVMRLFADDVKRFETVDQALAYFASVYTALGDSLSRAELQQLRRALSSARALAVGIPTRTGAQSDRIQTIIVINENMRRFRDTRMSVPPEEQDAKVLAHEVGHIISDLMGLGERLSALPAGDRLQVGQELNRVFIGQRGRPGQFDDYARNPEEWIAEFFMLYLLSPEDAKLAAPLTAAIIRKWWNENPAVNRTLILSKATQGADGLA